MLNFFKKKPTADDLTKEVINACAYIIYNHEDQTVRIRWLACKSILELKSLIKDLPVLDAIQEQFNSPKFHRKYKKLTDKQLEQVKTAIYYSFMEMRDFIDRRITIWLGQKDVQERTPGMRVSWRFPELNEYPEQYLKIKSVFT